MENTPLRLLLMVTDFTAPVPLNLKPVVPLAFQPACGRSKDCWLGVVPSKNTSSLPPPWVVGFPTIVLVLAVSLPEPVTLRLAASPPFTVKDLPRIDCSAANARPAAHASPAAAIRNLETFRMS